MSENTEQPVNQNNHSQKPVVIYILILFAAAFLLMSLSFLMSQRTNAEALGQIQTSVSAMQEIQTTQETIIDLQRQLVEAQDALAEQEEQAAEAESNYEAMLQEQQHIQNALLDLYRLQQSYDAGDYESCGDLIAAMERTGSAAYLPAAIETDPGATPPSERYLQLKELVSTSISVPPPEEDPQ